MPNSVVVVLISSGLLVVCLWAVYFFWLRKKVNQSQSSGLSALGYAVKEEAEKEEQKDTTVYRF